MKIDAIRDDSLNGWLIAPVGNLGNFLADGMVLAGVTQRALMNMKVMPVLWSLAKDRLSDASAKQAIQSVIDFGHSDGPFAEQEVSGGFSTISTYHAVTAWAATETTIEQTLVNLIRNVSNSEDLIKQSVASVKVRKSSYEQAKRTCRDWEGVLPRDLNTTMDRALHMLAIFDVRVALDAENQRLLSELAELRNVILHSSGFVDQRFLNKCPWRKEKPGDHITIDTGMLGRYFDATSGFAARLMQAITSCPHMRYAT